MAEQKRFAGLSTRSQLKAANNLGIILQDSSAATGADRRPDLDGLDAYYENRQYAGKGAWDQSKTDDNNYIPVRDRKPLLQFNFARMLVSRVAAKLVGKRTFPNHKIEEDPETEELVKIILKTSKLATKILEPVRRMLVAGSSFVRFSIVQGQWKIEHFLSKHCFPEFDAAGNLEEIKIKYVFEDHADLDERKRPKKKWFKMEMGKMKDVMFDNPPFDKDVKDPVFKVVATADHELGFVQGEWLKTADLNNNKADGPSLIEDILPFIDELNYSMSQSSTAIQYNQDPQLTLTNMDEDEVTNLIRSATKAWNLGREGEASFLEASMNGVDAANEWRDKMKQGIQDLARVVMLDPEKIVGSAQSAKAMEVLHGPLVELIEELRPCLEKTITNLILKMTITNLIQADRGAPVPVSIPPGFKPKSLNIVTIWPPIFAPTMQDLQAKVQVAVAAASGNLIARETMTRWLAKDFDVENIEEEIEKILAQPVINPFGGF